MVVKSFSQQSGIAEFQATSVIVGNKEYALPTGALVVRGENGAPLTLAKRGGSGKGLFQSLLPAFFAGVSQAGQSINQPTSSATVSGGSVSATTTSNNPSAGCCLCSRLWSEPIANVDPAIAGSESKSSQPAECLGVGGGYGCQGFCQ